MLDAIRSNPNFRVESLNRVINIIAPGCRGVRFGLTVHFWDFWIEVLTNMDGYQLRIVSSVGSRDGISLELADTDGEQVAEVFEDGDTGRRTVTVWSADPVPLEAMEMLLREAQSRL